jgi:hypothetical protein
LKVALGEEGTANVAGKVRGGRNGGSLRTGGGRDGNEVVVEGGGVLLTNEHADSTGHVGNDELCEIFASTQLPSKEKTEEN